MQQGGQYGRRLVLAVTQAQSHEAVIALQSVLRELAHFTYPQLDGQRRQVRVEDETTAPLALIRRLDVPKQFRIKIKRTKTVKCGTEIRKNAFKH